MFKSNTTMTDEWNIVSNKKTKQKAQKQNKKREYNEALLKMEYDDLIELINKNGRSGQTTFFSKIDERVINRMKINDFQTIIRCMNDEIYYETIWSCESESYFGIAQERHYKNMQNIKVCLGYLTRLYDYNIE